VIEPDDQLQVTQTALSHFERSLATLNRQKSEIHPARFELMAGPILDQIRKLRADIDAYLGMPVG
jgi:hypothetical protein